MEEILDLYEPHAKIDILNLAEESANITKLFNKFIRIAVIEGRELRKLESRYKQLYNLKCDWYMGTLNGTDELEKLGWEPQRKVVLKADLGRIVEGDKDVLRLVEILGEQKDKVNVLREIVKEIKDRSFNIKNSIEDMKFKAGM